MTDADAEPLRALGWKPAFDRQVAADESVRFTPARVASHLGSQVLCLTARGEFTLPSTATRACGDLGVGDWLLFDQESQRAVRRLERESLIARRAAGERADVQLIAANLDTLFVVTSCNHDFNPARLERYLALAADAEVSPVVVITKSDACDAPVDYRQQASVLMRDLVVESLDARDPCQAEVLSTWCGVGQTVALVGSSGVGKSTLAMSLGAGPLATSEIRAADSRGRHTTTARCIHRLAAGGLLIDTPGMRELQLTDCETGVAEVFDDIVGLAGACRYRDCQHQSEPGCAVLAAIEAGELDARRLVSYRKLQAEQARNAQTLRERRQASRHRGRFYKSVQSSSRKRKGDW